MSSSVTTTLFSALADGSPLKSGPGFPAELEEALDEYWRGALPQAGR